MADAPLLDSKAALRRTILGRRARRPLAEQESAGRSLADQLLSLPELAAATRVAAYVAGPGEPETRPLMDQLARRGAEVLLPVLLDDFDLDWAPLVDLDQLRPGRFGILEPDSPRLGVEAVAGVEAIVCPGVAGDPAGHRLGRGGGSFDRVLVRLRPQVLRCLALYDDEVLDVVPTAHHDQPVDVLVTPTRVLRTSRLDG
jgi:5-formyltetrahydrofolate cyclo-ligase